MVKKKRSEVDNKIIFIFVISFLIISLLSFSDLTGFLIVGCSDTDNSDKYVKGTMSYQGFAAEDECFNNNLVEYFCSLNGFPSVTVSECPEGCSNGACNKNAATKQGFSEIFQISQPNNILGINKFIGTVVSTINEKDMPKLLKSSSIMTMDSISGYRQYIRFNDTNLTTGQIKIDEDIEGEFTDFLYFDDNNFLFEYEIDFSNLLTGEISTNNKLSNLHYRSIHLLNKEYEIADTNVNGNEVELKFIGGKIKDTLKEWESKSYLINEESYNIKIALISNNEVIFEVNNERSSPLSRGETSYVSNLSISVSNILMDTSTQDTVIFYLDSTSFKLRDTITDDNFRQGIEINGNSISDGFVQIKGIRANNQVRINNIKYKARANGRQGSDVYVSQGDTVSKSISKPDLFFNSWDILYSGLIGNIENLNESLIIFNPSSSRYRLVFTNTQGKTYTTPLISNNGGTLTIGDKENSLYFIESDNSSNYTIAQRDYFVLTTSNSRSGITNIMRYKIVNENTKQVIFADLSGSGKEVMYSGNPGINAAANLIVSGKTYKVFIGPSPDYKLAIDLNGNGNIAGEEVNIIVNGGGMLDLGSSQISNVNFNMTLTTESKQLSNRNDNEVINLEIQKSGGNPEIYIPSQQDLTLEKVSGGNTEGVSTFGTRFLLTEKSGPDKLTIKYPNSQVEANVSVIAY